MNLNASLSARPGMKNSNMTFKEQSDEEDDISLQDQSINEEVAKNNANNSQ